MFYSGRMCEYHVTCQKHVFTRKMSNKRKATTVLVRTAKKPFYAPNLLASLQGGPTGQERAQANRNAAILIRQARMNAMPLQRANPNEKGFVDVPIGTFNFNTTGSVLLLATVAQGAGTSQRVGKKIMWSSIQVRGFVFSGTTTTLADASLVLIYDKRPTGTVAAVTDILQVANSISMNNDDNTGRFQIVRRWNFVLCGNSLNPTTGKEVRNCDDFVKFRRPCIYKAAGTGAIGDIEEGALYIMSIGNVAAGTGAATGSLSFRIRYTET